MKFGFGRYMLMNSLLDDGAQGGGQGDNQQQQKADDKNQQQNQNQQQKADDKNKQQQTQADDWKNGLPDDLKNDPTIKNLKDVPAALRMLLNAQKLIGKDKLVIPEASASDEQWAEAMKKLGLPEDASKYDFKSPEGMDADFLKEFKDFGVKAGILPRQAEKLMGWFKERADKMQADSENEDKAIYTRAVDGLKREWGQAFDRKLAEASGMFKQFTDEETRKELRELGFSNHPSIVKMMAKIAEAFGPGKFVNPEGGNGAMGITPEEAEKKITEVYSKYPAHPYFDKNNAGHEQARKEMALWNQAKLAGKKK